MSVLSTCKLLDLSNIERIRAIPNLFFELKELLMTHDFKFKKHNDMTGVIQQGGGDDDIIICPQDKREDDDVMVALNIVQNYFEQSVRESGINDIDMNQVIAFIKLGMTAKWLARLVPPSVKGILNQAKFNMTLTKLDGEEESFQNVTTLELFTRFSNFCENDTYSIMKITVDDELLKLEKYNNEVSIIYLYEDEFPRAATNDDVGDKMVEFLDYTDGIKGVKLDVLFKIVTDFEAYLRQQNTPQEGGRRKKHSHGIIKKIK